MSIWLLNNFFYPFKNASVNIIFQIIDLCCTIHIYTLLKWDQRPLFCKRCARNGITQFCNKTPCASAEFSASTVKPVSISIATIMPLQKSKPQSSASNDDPCLHHTQCESKVDILVDSICTLDWVSCIPIPEQRVNSTFSKNPTDESLNSRPFPDMLLKMEPDILTLLLPPATKTLVLQFVKVQSVTAILLLTLALIAHISEFSTEHRSNSSEDSETTSMQLSAIFSNAESFACTLPLGPKEYTHFWQSYILQAVSCSSESLHLQPNLQRAKVDFWMVQIASESIIIPHIPSLKLQSLKCVLWAWDEEIPMDDSVLRLNVEFDTSNELFDDVPLNATPEQLNSQWSATTTPALDETHWFGMLNLHRVMETLVPVSPNVNPRPPATASPQAHTVLLQKWFAIAYLNWGN